MKLYENPGWGSAIIEAQLSILNLPCTLIPSGDLFDDPTALAALKTLNPPAPIWPPSWPATSPPIPKPCRKFRPPLGWLRQIPQRHSLKCG